jgi:ribonucleotide reductase alpha subunit
MNHEQYTDEQIIAALKETFGKVYLAAEKLGCHPNTIYQRSEKSSEVAETLAHYPGRLIDIAEAALTRSVLEGEPWAVRFALRTLGQKRGYTERPPVPPPPPKTKMKDLVQEMMEASELMDAKRKHRARMSIEYGGSSVDLSEIEKAIDDLTGSVTTRTRGRPRKRSAEAAPAVVEAPEAAQLDEASGK